MTPLSFTSHDDRMLCFTDRKDMYLMLHSSIPQKTDGIVRGSQQLLFDISVSGESRYENTTTQLTPDSFLLCFGNSGARLRCSLLCGALYLFVESYGSAGGVTLSVNEKIALRLDAHRGIACAGNVTVSGVPCDRSLRLIAFPEKTALYISFAEDDDDADKEAKELLSADAFSKHVEQIQSELEQCRFDTGVAVCTQALAWAQESGLGFVTTKNNTTGIWAGLPWFRDNWGRDTFISLPGILLVTGQFDAAKRVIQGFMQFQDKNPASPTYGRIPNRYDGETIIYNTADGPLWLIREILEYTCYTGDKAILGEVWDALALSIKTDIARRTDDLGFLCHGNADTWMDARIEGKKAWSPRGNRANDIQVLWYTALSCSAEIARLLGHNKEHDTWAALADKVKANFINYFWNGGKMADHIDALNNGDYRVRPNMLMLLTIPFGCSTFIPDNVAKSVTETAVQKLLFPYGICSLSQDDANFHPYHDNCALYHKDAAYHNGTIWGWNAGCAIGAMCMTGHTELAFAFAENLAHQILDIGCAGTMSENLSAYPNDDGSIHPSGTWSQAWSDAEFSRVFRQYFLGVRPDLLNDTIFVAPHLSVKMHKGSAVIPFGTGEKKGSLCISWNDTEFSFVYKSNGIKQLHILYTAGAEKQELLLKPEQCQTAARIAPAEKETLDFAKPTHLESTAGEPPCLREKDYLARAILSDYGISEA